MRIRYLDDEDSWINLNFDDRKGFHKIMALCKSGS